MENDVNISPEKSSKYCLIESLKSLKIDVKNETEKSLDRNNWRQIIKSEIENRKIKETELKTALCNL